MIYLTKICRLLISLTTALTFLGLMLWFSPIQASGDNIIYVNQAVEGGDSSGNNWANAYPDLQAALTAATVGSEIWVASGVYTPGMQITATFQLTDGVALYGGFAATETQRNQRDWLANVTVLSGDIEGNDGTTAQGVVTDTANIAGTNNINVITGIGVTNTARLDGFVVTAGQATGSGCPGMGCGGGMYNLNSNPSLTHVTFSGNSAIVGGGMHNLNSSPTLINVTFNGNSAGGGGGMYNFNSSPSLTNVTFSGNWVSHNGGGMYNDLSSNPILTNVTLSGNSSVYDGGGIFNDYGSNPTIVNSILWHNRAISSTDTLTASIANYLGSDPIFIYSLVQGSGGSSGWDNSAGTDGGNNIDGDPLFVTPVDPTTAPTNVGNFQLQADSVAIDAGNTLSNTTSLDQAGNPRVMGVAIDMGAYEHIFYVFLPLIVK